MADANRLFKIEIITPERVFYTGDATMIEFTTTEGDIGIYKHHVPLTAVIAPGTVTITEDAGKKKAAVHSGFAEILGDKVTLLAEVAEWPEEIDKKRAEEAKTRAERRLKTKESGLDVQRAEIALKKALVRIDVAK